MAILNEFYKEIMSRRNDGNLVINEVLRDITMLKYEFNIHCIDILITKKKYFRFK